MAIDPANLKFYLSGGAANDDPAASLGGARSTTTVCPETLNGLFDAVSGPEASDGDVEYRCVYFINEDADADGLLNAVAWVSLDADGEEEIHIALDLAGKNGTADTIADESTAPDPALTWAKPLTKDDGLALGDLAQNDYHAIWIRRTVPLGASPDTLESAQITVGGETL